MTDYTRDDYPVDPNATTKPIVERSAAERDITRADRAETRTTLSPEAPELRCADTTNREGTANRADTTNRPAIAVGPATGAAAATAPAEERVPLFAANEANDLRARWDSVQVGFVDEPRKAVQEAEALVADAAKRLSEMFATERQKLESQWDRGDVSTEDLRLALRRYRSFFTRLLSI